MGPARHLAHLRCPTLTSFHCTRGCPVLACLQVPWSAKNSEAPAHGKRGSGPLWFPQVTQVKAIPTKVKVCPKLFYCHSLPPRRLEQHKHGWALLHQATGILTEVTVPPLSFLCARLQSPIFSPVPYVTGFPNSSIRCSSQQVDPSGSATLQE